MQQVRRLIGLLFLVCMITGVVLAIPPEQDTSFPTFVTALRDDMERVADVVFEGSRPATWTGNRRIDSPTIIADMWFDNEQLREAVFGQGVVPPEWIGATTSNAGLVARNIRHDLELVADEAFELGARPAEWAGAPAIYRCDRTTQNIVYLMDIIYNIQPATPEGVLDYCAAVIAELDTQIVPLIYGTEPDDVQRVDELILAMRGDLERLADEKQGVNIRPSGWIGNKDIASDTLAEDNFTDLNTLAETLLGVGVRPDGWITSLPAYAPLAYRNLRYNLELLADETLDVGVRPNGWQGENPAERCSPIVQDIVALVQLNYDFVSTVALEQNADFCMNLMMEANAAAENPPVTVIEVQEEEEVRFRGESEYAFAYLDVAALEYMGVMPAGTEFRAWYRNFNESNMMFVSGDNFAVFIDRRWTTMEREVFEQLPTLEGIKPLTFCDAGWCNGPAPTPTPTGGGPLELIISGATPIATVAPEDLESGGKELVSWNHIRVNYLLQRPELGVAQVTLEICNTVSQINCEPVQTVFNNGTGTFAPVISQFNGLNVYELSYGYTTGLVIEGATLFSVDLWLNDPTLLTPEAGGQ